MAEELSIRESLSAAYDGAAAPSPTAAPAPEAGPAPAARPPERAPERPEDPSAPPRPRAPDGRFAPKAAQAKPTGSEAAAEPPAEEPDGGEEPAETPMVEPAQADPTAKPPANMKARLRENWAALPKEYREEFHRLNVEAKKALDMSTAARRTASAFEQTIQPYRAFIQGEPLQVVNSLLQTAAQLQTAPPAGKAAIVAQIIKGYGVDVNALADVLEGQQPAQPQAPQEFKDPRFDQFLQHLQSTQQVRAQKVQAEAATELEKFAASHEFYEDVREDMADLLQVARKNGRSLTLEAAYERACALNPDVQPLYEHRRQVQAQANARASTQAARAASSSVRHEPTAPTQGNREPSLRGSLEAAWAASMK